MKNMKKVMLSFGTMAAIAAPISAVVACNNDDKDGKDKKVTPTLDTELAKFADFASTDLATSTAATLAPVATDVKTQFAAITGYTKPTLADGFTLTKVVVKTAINATHKVVFTITISDGKTTKTKDVTVTFGKQAAYADELTKIKSWTSPATNEKELVEGVHALTVGDDIDPSLFKGIAGYAVSPAFSAGITIKSVKVKTAYDSTKKTVTFEVELQGGSGSPATKDVTVTFS